MDDTYVGDPNHRKCGRASRLLEYIEHYILRVKAIGAK